MSGELFIVATPIGNLDDITLRAIQTLKDVDIVAAEDTRHSQHLLQHLGISKKMVSLHEYNERERVGQMLAYLEEGKHIALISDAGTPLISDPGFPLLRSVIAAGIKVTPVPGVSSIIAALSSAGVPADRFCFHGFLSHKPKEREHQLSLLMQQPATHVCLESTHRIESLIAQIHELLPDAPVVLAKELTKRHENFLRGTAAQCLQRFNEDRLLLKGEFVVLIQINEAVSKSTMQCDSDSLLQRLMQDMSLKKAVRLAADLTGSKKNDLYQRALALNIPEQAGKD